tara:strand:+ start:790 stop:1104 length:315 start_codon:yes stop_codon:yes gene_type:complete
MTERHKHYDVIIAYANGAKIQVARGQQGPWNDCYAPNFNPDCLYRVKPEPEPDAIMNVAVSYGRGFVIEAYSFGAVLTKPKEGNVLGLTFDGETGKLKHVEIVK